MSDPQTYWESKIIDWDALRYEGQLKPSSLVYKIIKNPQDIIEYRKQLILQHMQPYISGKHVIELGCGTGRMAKPIIEIGARSYQGADFTKQGIQACLERTEQQGIRDCTSFQCIDIADMKQLQGDYVFTNGVIAYLSNEVLDHLFSVTHGIDFFHINNEPRINLRQLIRRLIEFISNNNNSSKFRNSDDVISLAEKYGCKRFYTLRNKKLHTLSAISSLPFPKCFANEQVIKLA